MTATPEIAPGTMIAGYRLLEQLGRTVFRAEAQDGTHCVLRRLADDDRPRDALAVEAGGSARALELIEDSLGRFLAEESVDGTSLASLIGGGTLPARSHSPDVLSDPVALFRADASGAGKSWAEAAPWAEILAAVSGTAQSLRELHGRGTVHGGLTPARILLVDGSVRLVGRGISRAPEIYVAPEVLKGEERRPASDVFAFGAILFQSLTGELPKGMEVPSELVASLPSSVDELFRRCYCRSGQRIVDGSALVDELLPVLIELEAVLSVEDPDPGALYDVIIDAVGVVESVVPILDRIPAKEARKLLAAPPQPVLLARPETEARAFADRLIEAGAQARLVEAGAPMSEPDGYDPADDVTVRPPRRQSFLISLGCFLLFLTASFGVLQWSKSWWRNDEVATSRDVERALADLRKAVDEVHQTSGEWPILFSRVSPFLLELGRGDLTDGRLGDYAFVLLPDGEIRAVPADATSAGFTSLPGAPVEKEDGP